MINKFDLLPYPEDAVSLDLEKEFDSFELVYLALKTHIDQRNLIKSLKLKNISKKGEYLKINNFYTQVVLCSHFDDEVKIPVAHWRQNGFVPQLILTAQVDNENNIISFPGILTSNEIDGFINKNKNFEHICIPIAEFQGGLDLLYSYVTLLKSKSIPRKKFYKVSKTVNMKNFFYENNKVLINLAFASVASIIFIPKIFEPRLAFNITDLRGETFIVTDNKRGENKYENKFCILSPLVEKDFLGANIRYISIDKPVLIFKEALNEISIIKDNKVIWEKKASLNNNIITPLKWPVRPIEINDSYILRLRPVGSPIGQFRDIRLEADTNEIKKIKDVENLLGKNGFKWAEIINKNIEKNPNLSIALLFSDKIPSNDIFVRTKNKFINDSICE